MILDFIIILIIVLSAFIGYKQGLIKVAIKLISFIIAIIVALTIYKPVSNYIINKTNIDENIENKMTSKILPEGTHEKEQEEFKFNLSTKIMEGAENTVQGISKTITTKAIELASLLLIFIIVRIILKFVTALADLIAKLPILKQFNEVGGLIYGILKGFVWIFVIFAIISLISPIISQNYITKINEGFLSSLLYNNNVLLNIIK